METINIGDGKLSIGSLTEIDAQVNMLSGGSGQIVGDDVAGEPLEHMKLDFAWGVTSSFTILRDGAGGSTDGYWEAFIAGGNVSIGGSIETDETQFKIVSNGLNGNTLSLAPLELALGDYDTWAGNFAQADLSDPTGDFDGDGLDNLMEYALGGIPTNADAASIAPVFQALENYFVHVHNERTDDSNLTYTVELSTNLVSNGWNTNGLEFVGAAGFSNVWNVVTNKAPTLGKDQQFTRLKIEME